jgi:hypothetical protein
MTPGDRQLETLLRDHQAAVEEFVERAIALPNVQWLTPRAEGKWTPAQETRHLVLAYEVFTRDLNGGTPMALRGTPAKRAVWRLIGLTSILWLKRIPVAIRTPREARPEWETTPRDDLLPQLVKRVEDFATLFARMWRTEPRRRVTHPFFGPLALDHAIGFATVHTRHHAAFLQQRQRVNSLLPEPVETLTRTETQ